MRRLCLSCFAVERFDVLQEMLLQLYQPYMNKIVIQDGKDKILETELFRKILLIITLSPKMSVSAFRNLY